LAHCDLSDLDTFDADDAPTGTNIDHGRPTDESMADQMENIALEDVVPLPLPLSGFQALRLLDLSDCNLSSWTGQISRLRDLPQLTDLVLNDNPIESIERIETEEEAASSQPFASLATIQLTNVNITSWSSIDALNRAVLPNSGSGRGNCIKSLRFRNNPVTSGISAAEARSVTIARLPTLEYLNASPVGEKERVDSERRYVSTVARELLMAETAAAAAAAPTAAAGNAAADLSPTEDVAKQREDILSQHPRFEKLTVKHKDAMAAAQASAGYKAGGGGGSLSHDAINVAIKSMAASSCGLEPLRRRLPGSLAVGRVKIMCARAFGLDVDLQTLHYRVDGDPFPTELDDDGNTLSYYGVSDGAEILMNEVDVEARKRDEEREKAMQEQRIEEQERTATALQAAQTKGFEVKA